MMITKMSVPRRTFLHGMGATLALPFLDAMVPALSATAKTAAPKMRMGFFYVANGITMPNWHPKGDGTPGSLELSPIMSPLTPVRDQVVAVTGCANFQADDNGSGPHTRCHAVWLTGAKPKRTEGADIHLGTSIDQHAATKLGQDTPLRSLELSLEPNYIVGNCDNGYSCVYQNTFSWRTPTTPMPMETNPRVVFERMFGDGGSASARLVQMGKDRSILDAVAEDFARLRKRLGAGDRLTVNGYLEAVRDVERRIQIAEQRGEESELSTLDKPLGIPESDAEHAKLMIDLAFLAYQAEATRVVNLQLSREQSQRTYPYIGVPQGHHSVSHTENRPRLIALNSKINMYHLSLVARLAEKMHNTPDGDGTLLDHAILMHGSGMGNGDFHAPHDLPVTLVGGGCGQLKGARVVRNPVDTPLMNVGLSLLDKIGVELESLGDSTGRCVDL